MEQKEGKAITTDLRDRVLAKLGFSEAPAVSLSGLNSLYAAWCCKVPFDNVRKLVHLHEKIAGPMPGTTANDFFENGWLEHGTGGTCWAGNGALRALLVSLGFDASLGVATMLVAPDIPPNHGTVVVHLNGKKYIVDASILHVAPIELIDFDTIYSVDTSAGELPFADKLTRKDDRWHITWKPLHRPEGLDCRIEHLHSGQDEYNRRYEQTRLWSPFNYELTVRLVSRHTRAETSSTKDTPPNYSKGNGFYESSEDRACGIASGRWTELSRSGQVQQTDIGCNQDRIGILVDRLGISEEMASRVPADRPTPPPPWSKTALTARESPNC